MIKFCNNISLTRCMCVMGLRVRLFTDGVMLNSYFDVTVIYHQVQMSSGDEYSALNLTGIGDNLSF